MTGARQVRPITGSLVSMQGVRSTPGAQKPAAKSAVELNMEIESFQDYMQPLLPLMLAGLPIQSSIFTIQGSARAPLSAQTQRKSQAAAAPQQQITEAVPDGVTVEKYLASQPAQTSTAYGLQQLQITAQAAAMTQAGILPRPEESDKAVAIAETAAFAALVAERPVAAAASQASNAYRPGQFYLPVQAQWPAPAALQQTAMAVPDGTTVAKPAASLPTQAISAYELPVLQHVASLPTQAISAYELPALQHVASLPAQATTAYGLPALLIAPQAASLCKPQLTTGCHGAVLDKPAVLVPSMAAEISWPKPLPLVQASPMATQQINAQRPMSLTGGGSVEPEEELPLPGGSLAGPSLLLLAAPAPMLPLDSGQLSLAASDSGRLSLAASIVQKIERLLVLETSVDGSRELYLQFKEPALQGLSARIQQQNGVLLIELSASAPASWQWAREHQQELMARMQRRLQRQVRITVSPAIGSPAIGSLAPLTGFRL